jgi:hypothetical protein
MRDIDRRMFQAWAEDEIVRSNFPKSMHDTMRFSYNYAYDQMVLTDPGYWFTDSAWPEELYDLLVEGCRLWRLQQDSADVAQEDAGAEEPESSREDRRRFVIENYTRACIGFRSIIAKQGFSSPAEKVRNLEALEMLERSRIFEVPGTFYFDLVKQLEDTLYPSIAGCTSEEYRAMTTNQMQEIVGKVAEAVKSLPFPTHLPFKYTYIAYDCPIAADGVAQLGQNRGNPLAQGFLVANVLSADGAAFGVYAIRTPIHDGVDTEYILVGERDMTNEAWTIKPFLFTAWTTCALVAAINDHVTVVEERPAGKRTWDILRHESKKHRQPLPTPPAYYTVHVRDKVISPAIDHVTSTLARRTTTRRSPGYRFDVMGHPVVRYRRGPLPMDPKLEDALLKRRYKIWQSESTFTSEGYDILLSRGVEPKGLNEWIAVQLSWRSDYVKGPETAPYIPSVHRSKKWGDS